MSYTQIMSSSPIRSDILKTVVVDGARSGRIRRMVETFTRKESYGGHETIIGFEAEWTSHGAMTITGQKTRVSHLIFSNGDIAYVFILGNYPRLPDPVLFFLRHPNFTFVGMGIEENIVKLGQLYQASCRNAVELGQLAAEITQNPRLRRCGIDILAEGIFLPETPRPTYVEFEVGFDKPYPSYDIFDDYKVDEENVSEAVANTCAYQRMGKTLLEGSKFV